MTTSLISLYHVREGSLCGPEISDAEPEEEGRHTEAQHEARPIDLAGAAEKTPAEAIDDANDRIEAVEETPMLGYGPAGEADRRHVKAELQDERNDEAEVSVLHIESSDPQRWAKASKDGEDHEQRQEDDLPVRQETEPSHQQYQHHKVDDEIYEGHHSRGRGHHKARKVHLRDQVGVTGQTVGGLRKDTGEQEPRHHAGEHHDRIGRCAIGGKIRDVAEDDREHHHREERPDHRPGHADHRLLVAHSHVAPGKDLEQLTIMPEVAPVVPLGTTWLEDDRAFAAVGRG